MKASVETATLCSVVIPVHDGGSTLAAQLECLANQVDAPSFEVIVVLNRCTDSSGEVARAFADRLHLRIITADEKPSAAYARNRGADAAVGEHLLFCDADDRVGEAWIREMHLALAKADFVASRIEVDRTGLPAWIFERYYSAIEARPMPRLDQGHLYPVSAGLGVRRELFAAIGGFDENFVGAGFEEVDLAHRLASGGARVGVCDASVQYEPRRRLAEIHRQRVSYARGNALYDVKYGRVEAPVRVRDHARMMCRLLAHRLLKRPRMPPLQAIEEVVSRHRRWCAYRGAMRKAVSGEPRADTLVTVPLSTPVIGGLALSAHRSTSNWYGTDGVEALTLRVLIALLKSKETFVDVGSNIGTFALTAALGIADSRVVAFEPSDATRSLLEQNVARHAPQRITIRREAVAEAVTRRDFFDFNNHEISGFANHTQGIQGVALLSVNSVAVTSLDAEFSDVRGIVKIDVEGFEPDVLVGAAEMIKSAQICFIIELNPGALDAAGFSTSSITTQFPEGSWAFWLIRDPRGSDHGSVRRVERAELDALRPTASVWYANLLVAPQDRADEIDHLVAALDLGS